MAGLSVLLGENIYKYDSTFKIFTLVGTCLKVMSVDEYEEMYTIKYYIT